MPISTKIPLMKALVINKQTNKQTNNVYYFWQPKAGLSAYAHADTKEIHTNMSNTANVIVIRDAGDNNL